MTTQTNTTLVEEAVERAVRWLDLHIQAQGKFAASAKVQRRDREMMGVATLMAKYADSLASLPTDDDDTVERDAFERALRIRIWNELKERGVKDDECFRRIEAEIESIKTEARDAAIHTLIGRVK